MQSPIMPDTSHLIRPAAILSALLICFFSPAPAYADGLDKLTDTAKELVDKAGEVIENAEPAAPTASAGEGQTTESTTTSTSFH